MCPRITSRRELAESHRKVGKQMLVTRESGRGLEHLRKAVTLYLEVVAEQPGTSELRYHLAGAHNNLGVALMDQGDLTGALDQHRRALALREELVAADPDSPIHRRQLSITYESIGYALFQSGDVAGAIEINDKALALRATLASEDPTNADYRRILAFSYLISGDYRDQLGDKRGALDSFRRNISLNEELLAADPANAQTRGELPYSFHRLGDLLGALEDDSQALLHYRKALQMYEADAPDNIPGRLRVAECRAGVAKTQARLGERRPALEEYRKSIGLLEAIKEEPTNAGHRSLRAQVYDYLGEARVALASAQKAPPDEITQHWNAARDMFRQSLNVWEDMRARGILSVLDAGKPDEIARKIAKCDAALGR